MPTTGHLFERRYHAVRVDADVYLRQLVRYVHQNPLRAGMVTQLAQYPWSSHPAYLGTVDTPSWLTTAFVLGTFGNNRSAAVAAYAQYLSEMAGDPEVAALRAADFRELGVAPFPPDPARATLRPGSTVNLDQLIGEVCAESGVDPADLRSPRRYRRLGEVRALIARRARDEGVASLSEVARRFDRDESSLRKAVERRSPSRAPPLTRP